MKFILIFLCFIFHLFASEEFTKIRCVVSKIKEGHLEEVKTYYKSVMEERREAVLETFANEGMLLECAFIKEENGEHYVVLFMRAHDIDTAREAFRNSTLEEDRMHKEFYKKCFQPQEHKVLTPVYHLERIRNSMAPL